MGGRIDLLNGIRLAGECLERYGARVVKALMPATWPAGVVTVVAVDREVVLQRDGKEYVGGREAVAGSPPGYGPATSPPYLTLHGVHL